MGTDELIRWYEDRIAAVLAENGQLRRQLRQRDARLLHEVQDHQATLSSTRFLLIGALIAAVVGYTLGLYL